MRWLIFLVLADLMTNPLGARPVSTSGGVISRSIRGLRCIHLVQRFEARLRQQTRPCQGFHSYLKGDFCFWYCVKAFFIVKLWMYTLISSTADYY